MALKDEVTNDEILGRIPTDLVPSDLDATRVTAIREQVCGWIEDITFTTFESTSSYLNTAKMAAINYAACLCVVYAGAVPDVNANFSPDGELRINLSAMPKAIANYLQCVAPLGKAALDFLLTGSNLPTSNTDLVDTA